VGTQGDAASSGGPGQLFFDDIRLNREAVAQP